MNPNARLISDFDARVEFLLDPAPIHHMAPPPDRPRVTLAFLGFCMALGLASWGLPDILPPRVERPRLLARDFAPSGDVVDILLSDPSATPVEAFLLPQREGNGALDPSLPRKTYSDVITQAVPPNDLNDLSLPKAAANNADLSLPLRPSRDGRHTGFGEGVGLGRSGYASGFRQGTSDAGDGPGNARRAAGGAFDKRLVVLKKVAADCDWPDKDRQGLPDMDVRVVIEASGKVSQARMLSGPEHARACIEAAARRWEFEPLAAHGLRAPQELTIRFKPYDQAF